MRARLCRMAVVWAFTGSVARPTALADDQPGEGDRPDITHSIKKGEPAISGGTAYWENDWWYSRRNQDRNYTNGFGLQIAGSVTNSPWWLGLPFLLDLVDGAHDRHARLGGGKTEVHSLTLGSTAFTPDDLGATEVVMGDRPYASLLFLTASRLTVNPDGDVAFQSDLTVGMLGLDITRVAQTKWHQGLRDEGDIEPKDPQGWHHQISNGNELTGRYRLQIRKLLSSSCVHDTTAAGEGSIGYHTNVAGGGAIRVGLIASPFWLFDPTPLDAGDQILRQRVCPTRAWPLELYGWLSGRGRLVGYNALLQGQFAHSDYRLDWGDVSPLVLEGEAGLTLGIHNVTITYLAIAGRTAEFSGDQARSHTWGGVWIGYRGNWETGR